MDPAGGSRQASLGNLDVNFTQLAASLLGQKGASLNLVRGVMSGVALWPVTATADTDQMVSLTPMEKRQAP
jgi:hypothetical protein